MYLFDLTSGDSSAIIEYSFNFRGENRDLFYITMFLKRKEEIQFRGFLQSNNL